RLGDYCYSADPYYNGRCPGVTCGGFCDGLVGASVPGALYGNARRVAWAAPRCENVCLSRQNCSRERSYCPSSIGPYWVGLVSGDGQVEVITDEADGEEWICAYVCNSDVWTYHGPVVRGCGVEDVVS